MEKIVYAITEYKNTHADILISDKVDFDLSQQQQSKFIKKINQSSCIDLYALNKTLQIHEVERTKRKKTNPQL